MDLIQLPQFQGNTIKKSVFSAYIAVPKGSNIGVESLYAQQMTIHEKRYLKSRSTKMITYCPRTDAIKRLNTLIQDLQTKNQAIILMVDANQSLAECSISTGIKPHSIEWLRLQMGMDDPFIQLMGRHPNSMTQTPNRDIDFILTYGINITNISTLAPNIPSHSDHLGLVFDIDLHSFFSSTYSDIYKIPPRCLTSGNKSSIDKYITYISEQINTHKIPQRIQSLLTKADQPTPSFESVDKHLLNSIYTQVTEILLAGERLCSRKMTQ